MKAFKNDPALKEQLINTMQAHYEADEIIQGAWGENGKGYFLGCAIKTPAKSWYKDHAELTDTDLRLNYLIENIFERLPAREAKEWPLQYYKTLAVGADTSQAVDKFLMWLVSSNGVQRFAANPEAKKLCNRVHNLYTRRINGDEPTLEEWDAAAEASEQVAAVAEVAWSAVWAIQAAAGVDDAVAWAAWGAGLVAGVVFYVEIKDKLLEILRETTTEGEA
jgi:hypothetical protein